jgi:hypothetical protein
MLKHTVVASMENITNHDCGGGEGRGGQGSRLACGVAGWGVDLMSARGRGGLDVHALAASVREK